MEIDRVALEEWQRHQPLAILQLDPSDRVVLRVAGKTYFGTLEFEYDDRLSTPIYIERHSLDTPKNCL